MFTYQILVDYLPVLMFLGVAFVIAAVACGIPFIIAKRHPYPAKEAPYECGFDTFGDSRDRFDVRFYLIAILFIVFDLEVAFLFPWAITLGTLGIAGYASMMVFLTVLTVGFVYEWRKGALEWQ